MRGWAHTLDHPKVWLVSILLALCAAFSVNADPLRPRFEQPIDITQADIDWFRTSVVTWQLFEAGAPTIRAPEDANQVSTDRFEVMFLTFALHADLPAGTYAIDPDRLDGPHPNGLETPANFTLTQEHRQLIRHAWWRYGGLDAKYPYGNYNYTAADISKALGRLPPIGDDGGFFLTEDEQSTLMALHNELYFVLSLILSEATLTPGTYQLPVDGWDGFSGFRLTPASDTDIETYLIAWRFLSLQLSLLGSDSVDKVITWMNINDALRGQD